MQTLGLRAPRQVKALSEIEITGQVLLYAFLDFLDFIREFAMLLLVRRTERKKLDTSQSVYLRHVVVLALLVKFDYGHLADFFAASGYNQVVEAIYAENANESVHFLAENGDS